MTKKLTTRILSFTLALVMVFSLSGCGGGNDQEKFDAFLTGLPTRLIDSKNIDINFLFNDPQKFGFTEELLELPFSDEAESKESYDDLRKLIKEMEEVNRDKLDADSRLHYDVILDYFKRSLELEPFFYLDNSYLGSYLGYQAQLPLLLNEFTFNRKNDLDSYFNILETAEETFRKYADMERRRQEKGVGMSQKILDKVIGQCENFSADEDVFLIQTVNEKIDKMDFLSAGEKTAAKEKNEELCKNNFVQAYRSLAAELSTIEGSDDEGGLAAKEGGKAYYEALIHVLTGSDMSAPEVKKYLSDRMQTLIGKLAAVLGQMRVEDVAGYTKVLTGQPVHYSDFKTPEENLDYLGEQMKADYPPLDRLNYKINHVPEAMRDNFSPAAYLNSKLDASLDEPGALYINGDFDQSLFTTIAHEGYPGHMYQDVYYRQLDPPIARRLIEFGGYSEGWATYVEHNSVKYAPSDKLYAQAMELNSQITECVIGIADVGIHYEGWSKEQYYDFMREQFGDQLSQESLDGQYDLIVEDPANYLQYFLNGAIYQDMHDKAEEELGELFSNIEFNRVILETGSSSIAILQKQVDAYVKSAKKRQPPQAQKAA